MKLSGRGGSERKLMHCGSGFSILQDSQLATLRAVWATFYFVTFFFFFYFRYLIAIFFSKTDDDIWHVGPAEWLDVCAGTLPSAGGGFSADCLLCQSYQHLFIYSLDGHMWRKEGDNNSGCWEYCICHLSSVTCSGQQDCETKNFLSFVTEGKKNLNCENTSFALMKSRQ